MSVLRVCSKSILRANTIKNCDTILNIENGKLIEIKKEKILF